MPGTNGPAYLFGGRKKFDVIGNARSGLDWHINSFRVRWNLVENVGKCPKTVRKLFENDRICSKIFEKSLKCQDKCKKCLKIARKCKKCQHKRSIYVQKCLEITKNVYRNDLKCVQKCLKMPKNVIKNVSKWWKM